MKLYAISISPLSDFGTPLEGDTLFGHFCWQVAYRPSLVEGGLEAALSRHDEKPFAVFSSAFPEVPEAEGHPAGYALPRPCLPLSWLFPPEGDRRDTIEKRKKYKKRSWMMVPGDLRLDLAAASYVTGDELAGKAAPPRKGLYARTPALEIHGERPHNTINRVTSTTGKGLFAPYSVPVTSYMPGLRLAVFALLDPEAMDIDRLCEGLSAVGKVGFGRDASSGLGRFSVEGHSELNPPSPASANAAYTLAPCVPGDSDCGGPAYFSPFTRFGRHGDILARSGVPFKAPVIMAAPGAVFTLPEERAVPRFVGRAVRGISRVQTGAVHQGYAPCLPLKVEVPQ